MYALMVTVLLAGTAQLPPTRDAGAHDSATRAATGIIRGRVTDRESGQPLAQVKVTLVPNNFLAELRWPPSATASEPRTTMTGSDGRYQYIHVPAGAYVVAFDPSEMSGTHLRQYFGEADPADDTDGLRPPALVLTDGEVRNDVNGALWRSLAIEGRVLDEQGEPLANVNVSAHPGGLSKISEGSRSTDDRGAFRLFGLKPGRYRVCANPDGHFQLADDSRDRPIRTCYPATTVDADAEAVVLSGASVEGIEIRLQHDRAFTIAGLAVDSTGSPLERAGIDLVAIGKNGSSSGEVEMRGAGRFVAKGFTPGEYAVRIVVGSPLIPEDKQELEFGYALVGVDSADVDGIMVTTAKLPRVVGQIVFEGAGPRKSGSEPMRVSAQSATPESQVLSGVLGPGAAVQNDDSFVLTALPGPQFVTVTEQPAGWHVRSVTYGDDDVTDTPVEFKKGGDPAALHITMTRGGAVVSGRLFDAAGKRVPAGYAMLISADPVRRRSGLGLVSLTLAESDGSFVLGAVRAGEYIVAARIVESPLFLLYPNEDELERIVQVGERIVLAEGEKREIDLRVVKP